MALTRPENLTDRQWEVYERVVTGKSRQEIADELGLSIPGVKFHCQRIKTRLQIDGPAMRGMIAHAAQEAFL